MKDNKSLQSDRGFNVDCDYQTEEADKILDTMSECRIIFWLATTTFVVLLYSDTKVSWRLHISNHVIPSITYNTIGCFGLGFAPAVGSILGLELTRTTLTQALTTCRTEKRAWKQQLDCGSANLPAEVSLCRFLPTIYKQAAHDHLDGLPVVCQVEVYEIVHFTWKIEDRQQVLESLLSLTPNYASLKCTSQAINKEKRYLHSSR